MSVKQLPALKCRNASTWFVVVIATAFVICGGSAARAGTLTGTVQSGGNVYTVPLPNTTVTLYEATTLKPTLLQQTKTDQSGRFTIKLTTNVSKSIFYLVADLGNPVQFVAILGPNLPASVTVNELTTVAASYSMAHFFQAGVIAGKTNDLIAAAASNGNYVTIATGAPPAYLLASKNAGNINALRTLRSLANVLGICNFNRGIAAYFLQLTKPPGGVVPNTTAQAMANLALNPTQNVPSIYYLTYMWFTYSPGLDVVPSSWAIVVNPKL